MAMSRATRVNFNEWFPTFLAVALMQTAGRLGEKTGFEVFKALGVQKRKAKLAKGQSPIVQRKDTKTGAMVSVDITAFDDNMAIAKLRQLSDGIVALYRHIDGVEPAATPEEIEALDAHNRHNAELRKAGKPVVALTGALLETANRIKANHGADRLGNVQVQSEGEGANQTLYYFNRAGEKVALPDDAPAAIVPELSGAPSVERKKLDKGASMSASMADISGAEDEIDAYLATL